MGADACFPERNQRPVKDSLSASTRDRRPWFLALLPGLTLLGLGALVYWQFLFGDAVLLYTDIGSDSVNSYYPDFLHLSDYIRTQGFPSWSFYVGMGQDLAYATGFLIWQPVSWLPRELIAHGLVFQHLAKVLIAGLFFFRFLQLLRLRSPAPLLGSLLLCFSAFMCMGSCWYPLADEVVCFAGILLATEKALQHGRWLFLVLAVALVGMITPFHLYLCALFLLAYVPARLFGQYASQPRIALRICLTLAAVALLGIGLGAIVTLPYFYVILNSPRGSGTTSSLTALSSLSPFALESPLHYITAALKPFANDILGAGDGFRGWQNYLEAPLTYCGLLCLLLVPQIFAGRPRRHRLVFALFFAAVLIPTVFPWFRYLFWLFQGDYYRTYSLFCVLGVITASMVVFSRYLEGGSLNLSVFLTTIIVLLGILYLPFEQLQTLVDPGLKLVATLLLLFYILVLAAGQLLKKRERAAWIVLGLSVAELIYFSRLTVSERKTVKKEELTARVGYNDETVDVVRDIKARDDEQFFRLTKVRSSGLGHSSSLNDAMIFGYYGTASYSSFNNVNYTNFLTTFGAMPPDSETHTRWSIGLTGHPVLSLFACEKYALVDDPASLRAVPHYELVGSYGKSYLFRNQFFLPLGLTFDHYMAEDVFRQLPSGVKSEALLGVAVLSKTSGDEHGILPMSIEELEQEMKATPLPDVIALRRNTALRLTSFRQSRLEGTVRLDRKSILVLQTPFDQGWRASQDGQRAPVLKVDRGLLGVALEAGEHKVVLHYRNPFLVPALLVTLASLLVLGAGVWRWPRLHLPA